MRCVHVVPGAFVVRSTVGDMGSGILTVGAFCGGAGSGTLAVGTLDGGTVAIRGGGVGGLISNFGFLLQVSRMRFTAPGLLVPDSGNPSAGSVVARVGIC